MEPLLRPPIAFAHRGARARVRENTIEAFRLALELGATGLESDVWRTRDDALALDHDGVVRVGLRRRPIRAVDRDDLPPHVPTLEDLFAACGTGYHLSLDVRDPEAAPGIVAAARGAGFDLRRLWLCHPDWRVVASWRALDPEVRLVDSTRLRRMREGPERRAAQLAAAKVDCVNLHHSDWTAGLVTLFHRFGVHAFAWDAQFERVIASLVRMGIDGVFSDHPDRLVAVGL